MAKGIQLGRADRDEQSGAKLQMNDKYHRLVSDGDGHWYVIESAAIKDFHKWLDAAPYWEGYEGPEFDDCMVDGPHIVEFKEWRNRK